MSQEQRHCTNEELSAYLDGQLAPEERAACEAHMRTCEQCQQALATLRATVALLRALPQPQVPRSFVLPRNTAASLGAVPARARLTPVYAAPPLHAAPASVRRRWSAAALNTLRAVSALAAVIGIFLLFSSLALAGHLGGASGGAMSSSAVIRPKATQGQQTPNAAGTSVSQTPSPGPATGKTQAAPAVMLPDLGTATGRLQVGLFLLAIALLGFLLLRWQRQRTRAG